MAGGHAGRHAGGRDSDLEEGDGRARFRGARRRHSEDREAAHGPQIRAVVARLSRQVLRLPRRS